MGNAPEKPAPITPYLYYEDVAGALAWLSRVFGFREREKETSVGPDPLARFLFDRIDLLGPARNPTSISYAPENQEAP
jgi:hypothetical protein